MAQTNETTQETFKLEIKFFNENPSFDNSDKSEILIDNIGNLRSAIYSLGLDELTMGMKNAKFLKVMGGMLLDTPFTAISIGFDIKEEGAVQAIITGISSNAITTTLAVFVITPVVAGWGLSAAMTFVTVVALTAITNYVVDKLLDNIYDFGEAKIGEYLYNEQTQTLTYQTLQDDLNSVKDLLLPVYECSKEEDCSEYLKTIQVKQISDGKENIYTVVAGDTVWGISQRYGANQDDLIKINPWLKDRFSEDGQFALIRPGEEIKIPGTPTLQQQEICDTFTQAEKQYHFQPTDPLIIDLDGDGFETVAVSDGIYFDHDLDGFAETSSWVDDDDGVLAIDVNNNGIIDDGSELFGDHFLKSDGTLATSGFDALADFDSNGDGKVSAEDERFNDIKILKGDGTILTLVEAGIAYINLKNGMSDRYPAGNGNITKTVGTFYRTDGSMSHVADVLLNVDKFNSIAAEWLEVSDEIAALPDVAGCGYIYSLHQAMARDEVLTALVKTFTTETNLRTRNDLISQIIYCWAGVEDVAPDSRGANIDARQLEALEKFVAKDFKGRNSTTNPNPEAADILETAFRQLSDYVYAQIEMQSILKPLYNLLEINYDETSGKYVYNTNAVMTYIDNVLSVDTLAGKTLLSDFVKTFTSLGLVENSNFTEFSSHYTEMGEEYRLLLEVVNRVNIYGTESDDTIEGTSAQEAVFGYGGNDTIKTRQGDDIVYGGDGDDYIDTCEGNDIIFGEGGNDTILSGAGDDIVYGGDGNDTITNKSGNDYIDGGDGDDTIITQGKGNETLIGGKGNDYFEDKDGGNETFIFNKGDGQDHILNVGGNDKIIFGEGITPENIKFHGKNYDLYITFSDSSDSIKIDGYLQYTGNRIEIFEFSDGRILTPEEVMNRLVLEGTDENDTITGTQFTETIYGYGGDDIINSGAGDDIVYGGDGNDTITNTRGHDYIDGGAGDDIIKTFGKYNETLIGGKGNDYFEDKDGGNETFIFNKGDGQDHILNVGGNDTIHFGEGVRLEDIVFWKNGNSNDLIIDYGSEPGEDVIRIEQYRLNANHQIENFELETSEGEIMRLTNEDVNRLIQDMTAYAADNGIVLSSAADVRANEDLMTLIASSWAA